MKSNKMSYIIYTDIEPLIKKIDACVNNPENSSKTIIVEHIPCGYSMLTIWDFDSIENKHNLYRGEDYMKKNMLPLTKEELKSHHNAKACHICGKRIFKSLLMIKVIKNVFTIVILQVNTEAQHIVFYNLKFIMSNEIPVVFHS